QPRPDNTLPGQQPRPDNTLPGSQPRPDNTLPGGQGGVPTHPIVLPPDNGGGEPVYIWGPGDGRPTPPIVIPPEGETDDGDKIKYVPIWTPTTGWVTIGIVLPEGDHVTPSAARVKRK